MQMKVTSIIACHFLLFLAGVPIVYLRLARLRKRKSIVIYSYRKVRKQ